MSGSLANPPSAGNAFSSSGFSGLSAFDLVAGVADRQNSALEGGAMTGMTRGSQDAGGIDMAVRMANEKYSQLIQQGNKEQIDIMNALVGLYGPLAGGDPKRNALGGRMGNPALSTWGNPTSSFYQQNLTMQIQQDIARKQIQTQYDELLKQNERRQQAFELLTGLFGGDSGSGSSGLSNFVSSLNTQAGTANGVPTNADVINALNDSVAQRFAATTGNSYGGIAGSGLIEALSQGHDLSRGMAGPTMAGLRSQAQANIQQAGNAAQQRIRALTSRGTPAVTSQALASDIVKQRIAQQAANEAAIASQDVSNRAMGNSLMQNAASGLQNLQSMQLGTPEIRAQLLEQMAMQDQQFRAALLNNLTGTLFNKFIDIAGI